MADAVDVPRHHLILYVLFDLLVVLLVHLIARGVASRTIGKQEIWPPMNTDPRR